MEPIRITTTLSPHFSKGLPRGYYLVAQRLFPGGVPLLRKQQFLGFCGGSLVVTVGSPNHWDSIMKMSIHCQELIEGPVSWLDSCSIWAANKGFRAYISQKFLPAGANSKPVTGTGIFKLHTMANSAQIYYLEVPKVNSDILLGRKSLE